jgi:ParB-like chromosome segregation protein Spo0J
MNSRFIKDLLQVKLIPLYILKPSEEYNSSLANSLFEKISTEKVWTHPILINDTNFVIMDGHHRHQVAQKLQLLVVPALVISYDNPYLKLSSWVTGLEFNSNNVIEAGLSGKLLKFKSTRHELLIDLLQTRIPIEMLMTTYQSEFKSNNRTYSSQNSNIKDSNKFYLC